MIETESINALIVATPPSSHAEYISTTLDHELHVFCEKPLCLTLSQGKKLLAQNRRTDSVIRVGFQRRSNPSYQAIRDAIQSANLTGFTVEMYSDWFPRFEDTWRTDPEISGGGLTFDMGAHFVDILLWLTGRDPSVVRADMEFTDNGRIDSRSALTLRLDGGIRGILLFLGRVSCAQERLRLQAEQGQVEITATDWGLRTATRVDVNGNKMVLTDSSKTSQAEQFVAVTRGQRTELTTLEHFKDSKRFKPHTRPPGLAEPLKSSDSTRPMIGKSPAAISQTKQIFCSSLYRESVDHIRFE